MSLKAPSFLQPSSLRNNAFKRLFFFVLFFESGSFQESLVSAAISFWEAILVGFTHVDESKLSLLQHASYDSHFFNCSESWPILLDYLI